MGIMQRNTNPDTDVINTKGTHYELDFDMQFIRGFAILINNGFALTSWDELRFN